MIQNPKVSVIIPVYNAGHRLRACVESLVNQTLKDVELIFVLDCPTDGSDVVVMEYAERYDNIVIVRNLHNLNIGMSRNEGLKVAKGEYVAFCDHDDIVKEYMYKEMYKFAVDNDADIVLGVPEYCYPDSSLNEIYYYPQEGDVKEILLPLVVGKDPSMIDWKFYFSHGVIWDNIYRRKMIQDKKLRFVNNNQMTFEDNLFLIECLIHCNKAVVYNKLVYSHTIECSNTASTTSYTDPVKVLSYIVYLDELLNSNGLKGRLDENFKYSACNYIKSCYNTRMSFNLINFKSILDVIKYNKHIRRILLNLHTDEYIRDSKNVLTKGIHSLIFKYLTK